MSSISLNQNVLLLSLGKLKLDKDNETQRDSQIKDLETKSGLFKQKITCLGTPLEAKTALPGLK